MCNLYVFNIRPGACLDYLHNRKKCYLRLKWPLQDDVNQFELGGTFGQETSGDTYTLNQN